MDNKGIYLIICLAIIFTLEEKMTLPTWEASPREYTIKADGKMVSQDPIIYEVIRVLQDLTIRVGKLEKK